jgi:hypothetical protein
MQLLNFVSLALIGSTFASPVAQTPAGTAPAAASPTPFVVEDPVAPIIAGYENVKAKIVPWADAIKLLGDTTTTASAFTDQTAKLKDIISTLKSETASILKVKATIDIFGALGLGQPGEDVTAAIESAVTDLISKKDVFVKAGQVASTLENLKEARAAADGFVKAINSKLPGLAMLVAYSTSARPITAIDKAITAFSS